MKKKKFLLILSLIILLNTILLSGCSVGKTFSYSSNPTFDVVYSDVSDTSEVIIYLYIDNSDSKATISQLSFKCYFLDAKKNLLDTQEKTFDVQIKKASAGNYVFVFDSVKGRPQNIKMVDTGSIFAKTNQENVLEWLSQYWWIILIILVYVLLGTLIGFLCSYYIDTDFYPTEPEFWISIACGLFWPLGGIILLVFYLKDKAKINCEVNLYNEETLENWTVAELKNYCRENGFCGYSKLNKSELIYFIESNCDQNKELEKQTENLSINSEICPKPTQKNSFVPQIMFNDIAGLDEAKQTIQERIVLPLKHKEIYTKYGKKVGGGVLLYGLPGTGKTMFAQAVATELNAKFFDVKCSNVMSKWFGESEQIIKKLFADARNYEVSVIFFDEFDAIGRSRTEIETKGLTIVQEILAQMQGVEQSKNIMLVLAATNCPWNLDSALLRPGRFHEKIYIPLPDLPARIYMLNKNLGNLKKEISVSFAEVAKQLNGFNGADVTEFCEQIKMLLINKELSGDNSATITQVDIKKALQKVHSSVSGLDIKAMENYRSTHEK